MWRPIARQFQQLVLFSRWLLVPLLFGLICSAMLVIFKFFAELLSLAMQLPGITWHDMVVGILTLIDLTLITNLIIVIVFSAYESYFRRLESPNPSEWSADVKRLDFGDLKQKLLGSMAAIASVDALGWFLDLETYADTRAIDFQERHAFVAGVFMITTSTVAIYTGLVSRWLAIWLYPFDRTFIWKLLHSLEFYSVPGVGASAEHLHSAGTASWLDPEMRSFSSQRVVPASPCFADK